ncbi:MAG: STAS domain-containing protein [Mizugakiibacter sp.]|uniref:STAS domain-containing protein n=1 Tax=Mizugakiibacter sp. TaxID=1972610 RepID=UPI0031C66AEA|nr:STAS domain-containing protein [Xanthomonadaceae bacterium]
MSIYRARELKQTLHAPLEKTATIEVDLSAVTELDTAGLQLLLLAKRSAQARQGDLRIVAHSPAVGEVFALLQLDGHFGVSAPASSDTPQRH